MNWFVLLSCGVALLVAVGCGSQRLMDANTPKVERQRPAIETHTTVVFSNAVLIKPRETIATNDLSFTFAPLLIQEVPESNSLSNSNPETLYYQLDAVQIAGITRPRMTFLWSWGGEEKLTHGLRIILNARGFPVIWEVLGDRPGPHVVFVSCSLEEEAKKSFGSPAPGRRFAIERPTNASPNVVVARVIEDGPVAMGPIVHQSAGGEITAVICRCMSPQARQLVATKYYDLEKLPDAKRNSIPTPELSRNIGEMLRLPPSF